MPGPFPADAPDVDHDGILALECFLPYRLSLLTNTISRAIAGDYQQRFGLSIPQWRVMAVVGRFADLSANAVAEKTAMDKVMVSRAVAALLRRGLLARHTDPDDRRRSLLRLSADGRAIYRQIVPRALDFEARLLQSLSESDRTTLDRIIDRLTETGRRLGDTA